MRRVALALVLLAAVLPSLLRALSGGSPEGCARAGRGQGARRWLGCEADPGTPRGLAGDERLLLGLPLDLNRATQRELRHVPGLGSGLAREIVAERQRGGPFGSPGELVRVRGIGPKRAERARPFLTVETPTVGVADGDE